MADIWDIEIEDGWSLFEVGETTFNDAAIVEAGENQCFFSPWSPLSNHERTLKKPFLTKTIALRTLHEISAGYDLWSNNCHHFALRLIDNICPANHETLSTSKRYHRRSSSVRLVVGEEGK